MSYQKRISKEFTCLVCNKVFTRLIGKSTKLPKRNYCQNPCRLQDKESFKQEWTEERKREYGLRHSGKNNPNYDKKWSVEKREEFSLTKIEQYKNDPDLAYRCGSANRGIKFQEDRIAKMHANRTKEQYSHPHTEESKIKIGLQQKKNWESEEFRKKSRQTRIDRGLISEYQDEYKTYYINANW